jgi:NADPH-dependent glutamate synthase beta subunit-like oxidoreductase
MKSIGFLFLIFGMIYYLPLRATTIAVVGAGPAGVAVAESLTNAGHSVIIFESTDYVGGNIAHGYFYSKEPQSQLDHCETICHRRRVQFFGKVRIGENGALNLLDLEKLGFRFIVLTNGAKPKPLGIEGEELAINAADVFYYYNGHPEYPNAPKIGKRIALVGSGSSALDVEKYLLLQARGLHFFQLIRRGPGQYGHKSVSHFGNAFDALNKEKYRAELFRIAPFLAEVGEDLNHYIDTYLNFEKHYPNYLRYPAGAGSIEILHLVSPRRIIGDGNGNVIGIELERGKLVSTENGHDYKGIGEKFILPVDTVIRSVGGIADQSLGLPTRFDRVVTKNTEDQSIRRPSEIGNPERYWKTRTLAHYEVDFNQFSVLPTARVFVAGWARLPGVAVTFSRDLA